MARVRLDGAREGPGFDLTDAGQWKALTIHIVARAADVPAVAKLGPDPMSEGLDPARFAAILSGRKKQIKALLQDQAAFAGIGNAYSDEILHAAKISPLTHAASLSPDDVARLARGDADDPSPGHRRPSGRPAVRAARRQARGAARAPENGRVLPGVRRRDPGVHLLRGGGAVLPDLPDGRRGAGLRARCRTAATMEA